MPIRSMEEHDLDDVRRWRNADSVRMNMYNTHIISELEHWQWWQKNKDLKTTRLMVFENKSEALGVIIFSNYTGENGVSSWAFYSGDTSKRGVGPMMESAAIEYAFEVLKVRRLECEVLSFNIRVVQFHIRHGFEIEGILRDAYERNGQLFDVYKLAILRPLWGTLIKNNLSALGKKLSGSLQGKRHSCTISIDMEPRGAKVQEGEKGSVLYGVAEEDYNSLTLTQSLLSRLIKNLLSEFCGYEFPKERLTYLTQNIHYFERENISSSISAEVKVVAHIGNHLVIETVVLNGDDICAKGMLKCELRGEL